MNTHQRDPLFESLDRLAGLADSDLVGDRMPDIRHRVRVARQRRVALVATAAAVLAVVGVGVWRALPAERTAPPVVNQEKPSQTITIDAEAVGSEIRVSFTVTGQSTAYTDPETGEPLDYAGPESTEVIVDGASGSGEGSAPLSCEPGGRFTAYSIDYHVDDPLVVPVTPAAEHTVVVRAPYCDDGKLVENSQRLTVTSSATMTTADQQRVDLDGDGTREVLRIRTPQDPAAESQLLEVTWGNGESRSADLTNTMEIGFVDPIDLDGDGDLEVILLGGGGELGVHWVFQAGPGRLQEVATVDADGINLPLTTTAEWGVDVSPDGVRSYRLQDPAATEFPAPVDVRDWTLEGDTITQSRTMYTACVTFQPVLELGPC
ncbi:hypothetical protein NOCA2270002 [metagenome]|uniref:Uncharacterized protein n=1 Tax=metagenome TaxID=256318 RepID=A0A2P2C015_9ZZZZ